MCYLMELCSHKNLTNAAGLFIIVSMHGCYLQIFFFISFQSSCQWGTDIKDRLLHNQRSKCDYDQMCTQIVSEVQRICDITQMHVGLAQLYVLPLKKHHHCCSIFASWQKKIKNCWT